MMAATSKDKKNMRQINLWCFIWVLSWLGIKALVAFDILEKGLLASSLAVIPLVLGVGMVMSYRRFLREADEMLRTIQLEALAFAVGGSLVGSVLFSLLEDTGLVSKADISTAIMLSCVFYMIGVVVGHRRFQ